MIYIHTKSGNWLETINEAKGFYVLKNGGICFKDCIDNILEANINPIDLLLILLKKGTNITDEICGCDYEHYLNKTKNCSNEFILTKSEFEAIKKIHTKMYLEKENENE